jgi:hypothetical protein
MNRKNAPRHDESDRALDRAIRAVMAEPAPEEVKNRVIDVALGFAAGEPRVPRERFLETMMTMIRTRKQLSGATAAAVAAMEEVKNRVIQAALSFAAREPRVARERFLERMTTMIRTRKKLSVATAAAVAAIAAGLALSISLMSPVGWVYALEETAQANNHVTSYHIKITPAAELGEAWVQLNPDGTPMQARMDLQSPQDGAKVVILSNGKAEIWFKDKNALVFVPEADALKRVSEMRNLADPKLAFERLQAEKSAGKVQVETKQPAKDSEPIVLTVTSRVNPGHRQVYEVDPRAKLVERITSYRRTGQEWEEVAHYQYLDYNKPIDPKVFQPDMPKDIAVSDQITRKPGLVKGDLPDEEIAKKVVRAFFEALIAGDYENAGMMYEGVPAKKLKEGFGPIKFLRIIEIGKPAPAPSVQALRVPAKVEIEMNGRRREEEFLPFVRQPYGQPDRRVISGGI